MRCKLSREMVKQIWFNLHFYFKGSVSGMVCFELRDNVCSFIDYHTEVQSVIKVRQKRISSREEHYIAT